MADLRLTCAGARIGTLFIPPFQLRLGDVVCLHLPHPVKDDCEDALVQALTGQRAAAGLRLLGRIIDSSPACDDRRALVRWIHPLRATAWLRRRGASKAEANAVLQRIGLERDWPVTRLPGNPRTLLGLEAAWAGAAEGIVFRTSGLDPSGVRAVYTAVAARLASCPAIHISRAFLQNGRLLRDCPPGSACVELTESSAPPLAAESA